MRRPRRLQFLSQNLWATVSCYSPRPPPSASTVKDQNDSSGSIKMSLSPLESPGRDVITAEACLPALGRRDNSTTNGFSLKKAKQICFCINIKMCSILATFVNVVMMMMAVSHHAHTPHHADDLLKNRTVIVTPDNVRCSNQEAKRSPWFDVKSHWNATNIPWEFFFFSFCLDK